MKKVKFGSALSESTIRSMITEDIEWFIEQVEKEEKIPHKILITPFLTEHLQPASYDIHLDEEYISHMTGKLGKLGNGKNKLTIKPGETVTITSLEYIGLPQDITALVTSRTHLVIRGLSQMSTHIDPGFHGKLFQTLTNLSARDINLKYEEPIAHLTFFKVDGATPQKRYKGPRLGQKTLDPKEVQEILEIVERPGNPMLMPYASRVVLPIIGVIIGMASFFYGIFQATLFYMVGGAGLILIVLTKLLRRG